MAAKLNLYSSIKRLCAAIMLSAATIGTASAGQFGISPVAGTLGLGLELDYAMNDYFSIRLQGNQFNYDDDFEEDDINYKGEIKLSTYGLLVDYHPFSGAFRLTGGIYSNGNQMSGLANDSGRVEYEIGDAIYTSVPSDPLTLNADVELGNSSAGYLGLGWGHSPKNTGGLLLSFELGVIFSGEPTIAYQASGSAQVNVNGNLQQFSLADTANPLVAEFYTELDKEAANLQDDLSEFKFYPVLKLGIGYRF